MRTRQHRVEHYYVPLGESFCIIGATESPTFGRCFVVESLPRERTLRADGFEFETAEARDFLWEDLHKKELKRVAVKLTKEKHAHRKRRSRASDRDEHQEQEAQDRAEHDALWSRISAEYEPDVFDEQTPEVIDQESVVESEVLGED